MNGGETNADGANADNPTAWRPPCDALSAILQKSSGGNSATGFGDPEIQLSPFSWAMMPTATDRASPSGRGTNLLDCCPCAGRQKLLPRSRLPTAQHTAMPMASCNVSNAVLCIVPS